MKPLNMKLPSIVANFTLGAQGDLETRLGHVYQLEDDVGRLWSEYYMLELAWNDVEETLWPRLIMVQKKEIWPTLRPRIDKETLYATLSAFLEQSRYRRGTIDKTLFIKKDKKDIMLVQVYVDDIVFGSIKKSWCDKFEALMKNRFQMSSIGELAFFLRLQVKQKEDGIFIS
ncbi:putative ribonuclease H-like domain-containing protein [Tanacetum coccineum]